VDTHHRPFTVAVVDLTGGRELNVHLPEADVLLHVVDYIGEQHLRRALDQGAGVLDVHCSPTKMAVTVKLASVGKLVLPVALARATLVTGKQVTVSPEELRWLRAFARGARTADIAAEDNYSEREIYRRLRHLYRRLGVDGRQTAVLKAARSGWLDD
jgi:DNA-binding NarL/FixJ family response regulator